MPALRLAPPPRDRTAAGLRSFPVVLAREGEKNRLKNRFSLRGSNGELP